MDALQGNVWFSKLDANSAYWQIPLESSAREKTAFVTKHGLFEFVRMPFGLCNSPATYSRAMGKILNGLTWKTVLAFLDDICVLGNRWRIISKIWMWYFNVSRILGLSLNRGAV